MEDKFDVSNFEKLANQVEQQLRGKKFLLVLDDLWNESATEWKKLKSILNVGAHGSKILVTTDSRIVEYNVRGLFPPYNVKHLSNDDCWSIIREKAFSPGGALRVPFMEDIGKEVSKKCAGLPLAAIFFGHFLYLHNTQEYWLSVRDDVGLNISGNPSEIIPILKLSYDILPSQLKQCFSYTSIFPKGLEIEKEKLIQLWMAEGFLQPSTGASQKSREDIGNDYFESLLRRSFFEVVKTDKLGEILSFKIHDLLTDLARSVLGRDELTVLVASEMKSTTSSLQQIKENASEFRRLLLTSDEKTSKNFHEVLNAARKLRTVIASESTNLGLRDLVSNKCLRVVCLADVYHSKKSFSDVIGMEVASYSLKFMHLRYLDLSGFRFEELNEVSVGELYNLQTLVLSYCFKVGKILKDVGFLKNLRHLYLSFSDVELLPSSITSLVHLQTLNLHQCFEFKALPDDIGSLEHLKSLNLSSTSIKELPDSLARIRNLRRLDIVGCHKLKSLPRDLGKLTKLRCLDLTMTDVSILPESCLQNLFNLEIVNLGSACELPREIKNWANLKSLIGGERHDESPIIPEGIESLTRLQELWPFKVREDDVVTGNTIGSKIEKLADLNSLQVLYLENLNQVRGGKKEAERAKLKQKAGIQNLRLHFGAGRSFFDNIGKLGNKGEERSDKMVLEGLEPHYNLAVLRIDFFQSLEFPKWMGSSNWLPNMVKLVLSDCDKCVYLPTLGLLPCLRILNIIYMTSLKGLGEEFYGKSMEVAPSFFPSLLELKISGASRLEKWEFPSSLHNSFPLLKHLSISYCKNLRAAPNSFYSLKELEFCRTNAKAVNSILEGLTSLTAIYIDFTADLEYFPLYALRNNTCLQSLKIHFCKNLKGFHNDLSPDASNGTMTTSSLYSLSIVGCPALSSLPDLRLWTSLRKLQIHECNKLMESIPYDLESLAFVETIHFEWLYGDEDDKVQEIISVVPTASNFSRIGKLAYSDHHQVLRIRNLENVRGGREAVERARLWKKRRLRHLYLSWNSLNDDDDDEEEKYRSVNDDKVLKGLKPHTNLRKLSISGFEGSKLPKWVMGSSSNCLPNLVELYLMECNRCEKLPALGMLPCLRVLQIKGMNSVKCLGIEFYCQQEENSATTTASSSSGIRLFPSLMEMSLIDMSSLEEWVAPPHQYNSFPSLQNLIVSGCARLKSIPLASCSSLKSLELRSTNDEVVNSMLTGQGRGEQLTSLASVSIKDSPQLIYFPVVFLQKDGHIRSLEIAHCSKFKGLRIVYDDFQAKLSPDTGYNTSISSLCSLKLIDCPALSSLPDLRKWTCLTQLWIEDCDKLRKSFPYDLESLPNLETLYVDCFIDLSEEEEVDLPATTSN